MGKKYECLKCGSYDNPSEHHIYPKRHFLNHTVKVNLCRDCHDELEAILLKLEGHQEGGRKYLPERLYLIIFAKFLIGEE